MIKKYKLKRKLSWSQLFSLDFISLNNCSDLAYTPDCVNALNNGLCNANLSSSQNVRFYCQKTCGVCSSSTAALTCSNIVKTCNTGACSSVSYFNQATIQCTCPTGLAGTYCQRRMLKIEILCILLLWNLFFLLIFKENQCNYSPCLNGGTCASVNDEDVLYQCTCQTGCTGRNCTSCLTGCSTINCLNGASCFLNSNNLPYCVCASGYSGTYCQTCTIFDLICFLNEIRSCF